MTKQTENYNPGANWFYIVIVSVLTFVLPAICTLLQILIYKDTTFSFALFGK